MVFFLILLIDLITKLYNIEKKRKNDWFECIYAQRINLNGLHDYVTSGGQKLKISINCYTFGYRINQHRVEK